MQNPLTEIRKQAVLRNTGTCFWIVLFLCSLSLQDAAATASSTGKNLRLEAAHQGYPLPDAITLTLVSTLGTVSDLGMRMLSIGVPAAVTLSSPSSSDSFRMTTASISTPPVPSDNSGIKPSLFRDHSTVVTTAIAAFSIMIMLMIFLVMNIFLRKRAESSLRMSEIKYRTLFEKSPDAIFILDTPDIRIADVNIAALKLLGLERTEVIGRHPCELSPPTQPDGTLTYEKVDSMASRAMESGTAYFEITRRHASGKTFPAEVWMSSISFPDATILIAVWRDLSERKKMQEMIIQSEKMVSLGGLAAGMAHEINNPLSGIIQNAQVVQSRLLSSIKPNQDAARDIGLSLDLLNAYLHRRKIPEMLNNLQEAGRRASELVRNMLSFAKKETYDKIPASIPELLDRIIAIARNDFSTASAFDFRAIRIDTVYDTDVPVIHCHPGKLQQVFYNILKNGAESMTEKKGLAPPEYEPCFNIHVYSRNGQAVITIQDNGMGMSEDTRKKIFEPFYTTKPPGSGTGLGMSLSCFIIMDQHQGSITVDSVQGEFSMFTVTLPAKTETKDLK